MDNRLFFKVLMMVAALAAVPAATVAAQGVDPYDVFGSYLSRADRSDSGTAWLETARYGLRRFKDQQDNRTMQSLLEEEYLSFMMSRMFQEQDDINIALLLETLGQVNMDLLYRTAPDGPVLFDEAGDPLLRGAENYEADLLQWRNRVGKGKEDVLGLWREHIRAGFDELNAEMDGQDDGRISRIFEVTLEEYEAGVRMELDKILLQEEQRFTARRLTDVYSLKAKTDGVRAGEVVKELLSEADEQGSEELASLQAGLAALSSAVYPDPGLGKTGRSAEEIREYINSSLTEWKRLEEDLAERQLRWEWEAGKRFSSGRAAWENAYSLLREARASWDREMDRVTAGEAGEWAVREAELAGRIETYLADMARVYNREKRNLEEQLSILVQNQGQAVDMMSTAGTAGMFYLESLAKRGIIDRDTAGSVAFGSPAMRSVLSSVDPSLTEYKECRFWLNVWDTYSSLFSLSGEHFISVKDQVLSGSLGGDIQAERVKAENLLTYWEGQEQVALAVTAYGLDDTSGRDREGETEDSLARAAASYENALEEYNRTAAELKALEGDMGTVQDELAALGEELLRRQQELHDARQEYQTVFSSLSDPLPDREEYLTENLTRIRSLETELQAAKDRWTRTADRYAVKKEEWETLCSVMETSSSGLEQARLEVQKAEQIRQFASSGYLDLFGEPGTPGGYLEYTRTMTRRASKVLDLLEEVSAVSPEAGISLEEYGRAWRDYLELGIYAGALGEAMEKQIILVEERTQDYRYSMENIITADEEHLQERDAWIEGMCALTERRGEHGFIGNLDEWGLACWYLLTSRGRTEQVIDLDDEIVVKPAVQDILRDEGIDCSPEVSDLAYAAFRRVQSDPVEAALFGYYVDAVLSGSARDVSGFTFLLDTVILAAKDRLCEEIDLRSSDRYDEYIRNRNGALAATALSVLFPPYAFIASALYAAAAVELDAYNTLQVCRTDIMDNYHQIASAVSAHKEDLYRSIRDSAGKKELLETAKASLARLTCDDGAGEVTPESVSLAVTEACSIVPESLSRDPGALRALLAGLVPDHSSPPDPVSFLGKAVLQAGIRRDTARERLSVRVRESQANHDHAFSRYTEALDEYLSSREPGENDIENASAEAFQHSPAVSRDVQIRLFTLFDTLQEETGFSTYETVQTALNTLDLMKKELLQNLFEQGAELNLDTRNYLAAMDVEHLSLLKRHRESQIASILEDGNREWNLAEEKLLKRQRRWSASMVKEYSEKEALWNARRQELTLGKQRWVRKVSSGIFLSDLPDMWESPVIGPLITGLSTPEPNALRGVQDLVDSSSLSDLFDAVTRSTSGFSSYPVYPYTPVRFGTASLEIEIRNRIDFEQQELEHHFAVLTAYTALRTLEETRDALEQALERANEDVERGIDRQLISSGYRREGNLYIREAVVGATLAGGEIRETQTVDVYHWFPSPGFDPGIETGIDFLSGLTADAVYTHIQKGIDTMTGFLEKIFGEEDAEGITLLQETSWTDELRFSELAAEIDNGGFSCSGFDASSSYEKLSLTRYSALRQVSRDVSLSPGEFGLWVGYAPAFRPGADPGSDLEENIMFDGAGELGRIMGEYMQHRLAEGKGWGELGTPLYSRRLWNDDDRRFSAPSLREVIDFGVTLAATAFAGPQAARVIGLVDDAFFTFADIALEETSLKEGLLDLGKQALLTGATAGIGSLAGDAAGYLGDSSSFEHLVATTLLETSRQVGTASVSGALNAINFDAAGRLSWSAGAYLDGAAGTSALAGYASSAASGAAGSLLEGTLTAGNRKYFEDLTGFTAELAGGAAGYSVYLLEEARNSAGTGTAGDIVKNAFNNMGGVTFNLANAGALLDAMRLAGVTASSGYSGGDLSGLSAAADRLSGTGLLEWLITAEGSSFSLGTRGIDLGGALYSLGKTSALLTGIREYAAENNIRTEALLETVYGYGDVSAEDTVWRILSGADSLTLGDLPGGALGETTAGTQGGRKILLRPFGDSREEVLHAALALQHEAYRSGRVEQDNLGETVLASVARLSMAGTIGEDYSDFLTGSGSLYVETRLLEDAIKTGNFSLFENYIEAMYDSSGDFFFPRITTGGTYQNTDPANLDYPLLAGETLEQVERYNREYREELYRQFVEEEMLAFDGDIGDFQASMSFNQFKTQIIQDNDFSRDIAYSPQYYESVYYNACKLMCAMYAGEYFSGKEMSVLEVNRELTGAGIFTGKNLLSTDLMEKAMEHLTGGEYDFQLVLSAEEVSGDVLKELLESDDSYIAHLRIKKPGTETGFHSEMLSSLDLDVVKYVSGVEDYYNLSTANPWYSSGYTGNTSRSMDQVARWDIFKVAKTDLYYANNYPQEWWWRNNPW